VYKRQVYGLDVGQTFTYQIVATEAVAEGLPITYNLDSVYPENSGLSLDPNTGLMTWVAVEDPNNPGYSELQFTVTASDTLGQQESQNGYLIVCSPPMHYNDSPDVKGCE